MIKKVVVQDVVPVQDARLPRVVVHLNELARTGITRILEKRPEAVVVALKLGTNPREHGEHSEGGNTDDMDCNDDHQCCLKSRDEPHSMQ
jgi:hypothetical protein